MNEAQILEFAGLFIGLMGIGFIVSSEQYLRMIDDVKKNSAVLLTFGGINLIIGYLLVVNHNIWVWDWPVVITVIGWAALLKGVVIIAFPRTHLGIADWFVVTLSRNEKMLGAILLALGVVLTYIGRSVM